MTRQVIAAAGAALVVLAGAVAYATAAGDAPTTIEACRNIRHGLVRIVVDGKGCKSNESPLSWNLEGRDGAPGPAGPAGPAGPVGPKGDPGGGIVSVDSLDGTACKTFDGSAGKIDVGSTATDLITLTCEPGATSPPGGTGRLVINEVDYDQVGADAGGFVEIANTGTAAATLEGIALVFVNGGDGAEYARKALTGSLAAGARFVIDVDLQNGAPDGVALVDSGKDVLLDALSYEGAITTATIGSNVFNLVEGTMLPVDVADSNTVDGSLSRIPDGSDTGNAAADWSFTTTPTPGAANVKTP